ncbi:MAG TPA: NAD(P)H-dependent oxidoreductase [bacterium]|jgi:hypothetical protein|nr:NAD(P)H-dependent oxidoreductase [bacterium]
MQLLALNASPRGKGSNSNVILGWVIEGWVSAGGGLVSRIDLTDGHDMTLGRIAEAETILIAMPLYTDFIPGILKEVFDSLSLLPKEALEGKRLACVVHSGFPESIQSESCATWLGRAALRLGFDYAGCLIKAGSEGYRIMPTRMTARTAERFREAGRALAVSGVFPEEIKANLAHPRTWNSRTQFVFRIMALVGLSNLYWDSQLRKHRAFRHRFDAPYGPPA